MSEAVINNVLITLINELNSSVFVLLVILAVAFYLIYKAGGWGEKFLQHDVKLNDVQTMSDKIIELKTKVDLIYRNTNPNGLTQARSPVSLTDEGNKTSIKIGAQGILKKHLAVLIREVELEDPINAYDIQIVSIKVAKEKMLSLLNEEDLNIIKSEAFSKGLLVEDIMVLFGVMLRNEILKNKGIPIADVDKHEK